MSGFVEIVEVGPRDGLQNEPGFVPTEEKLRFISALSDVGFRRIEVASFVSPKWVPQMADAVEVMAGLQAFKGPKWMALVPNMTGFEKARAASVPQIAVFLSATEGFSQKNLNCSVAESLERARPVISAARDAGMSVRGYVSCVTDCPYEGRVAPSSVAGVVERLSALGVDEIALGETLGKGRPEQVGNMLHQVCGVYDVENLAGHFHDTEGHALQNISVSLDAGVRIFDASAGGLGGCPYAPGAAGNVATEAVNTHLETLGFVTGLDAAAMTTAARLVQEIRHGNT
ncbi:MAG: hydroxymethylglutaryl-CoA lyase [Pseudomonadota bacterium]